MQFEVFARLQLKVFIRSPEARPGELLRPLRPAEWPRYPVKGPRRPGAPGQDLPACPLPLAARPVRELAATGRLFVAQPLWCPFSRAERAAKLPGWWRYSR